MPLSRLCYAAYLINLNLVNIYSVSLRSPSYFNVIETLVTILGIVTLVFMLSFLASLLVEMPFLNLDKLLFASENTSHKMVWLYYSDSFKAFHSSLYFNESPVFVSKQDVGYQLLASAKKKS